MSLTAERPRQPAPGIAGVPTDLLIDGDWRPASDGGTLPDLNPVTEGLLADVASATPADVDAAVGAAHRQFSSGEWAETSGADRGILLNRLADLLNDQAESLARLQSLESGQPVMQPTLLDIPNTVSTFRHFAGWADKITGHVIPTPGYQGRPTHSFTTREPVGVVGAIVPWNGPLMIGAWKIAPALAAGCTVVVKPSEDAMLTLHELGRLALEAGFPPGVLNVIPGTGEVAGAALVDHPLVGKISFTGSAEVGRAIHRRCAERFTRLTLELGGKTPQIICADADLEAAVAGTAMGLFWNQGQICAAGTRVLVHRSLYYDVVDGLVEAARAVRLGDPFDPETTMGSLISRDQRDRVMSYVRLGQQEGATLLTGGEQPAGPGFFVEPTVFAADSNDLRIAQEEIFGPVGTVIPFDDLDEAVDMANGTKYGLAATVWTRNISTAHQLTRRLQAGHVSVNGWAPIDPRLPWGGMKGSGVGRELGWAGIEDCTEEKVTTFVL